jgi:hypothetical protein
VSPIQRATTFREEDQPGQRAVATVELRRVTAGLTSWLAVDWALALYAVFVALVAVIWAAQIP